tara:strand:+ start:106 stop:321 length:216 start_codon:yes stop_codon:yes gene_type:complete
MELKAAHSKKGGIIDHKNHTEIIVKTEFSGDENRFFLTQASIPDVFTGGGRSGCVPGTYSLSNGLFNFFLS